MRFAVVADVHGNWFALEAVRADATSHGVDGREDWTHLLVTGRLT